MFQAFCQHKLGPLCCLHNIGTLGTHTITVYIAFLTEMNLNRCTQVFDTAMYDSEERVLELIGELFRDVVVCSVDFAQSIHQRGYHPLAVEQD